MKKVAACVTAPLFRTTWAVPLFQLLWLHLCSAPRGQMFPCSGSLHGCTFVPHHVGCSVDPVVPWLHLCADVSFRQTLLVFYHLNSVVKSHKYITVRSTSIEEAAD
jgi:hypothetical protein